MDPVSPRQTDILKKARLVGRVEVDDLALQFDVTPQTIRKDLNEICDAGLLQRVHGGAVYPSGAINYAYDARRNRIHRASFRLSSFQKIRSQNLHADAIANTCVSTPAFRTLPIFVFFRMADKPAIHRSRENTFVCSAPCPVN
jgi:predicted DNA-binding transcriptional regulator YafY